MRFLSPRLQCLKQQPSTSFCQIRNASSSRYSSPGKRTVTTAPALSPSFIGAEVESQAIRNPLDARASYLEHEEKRQFHLRRMRFAGMGLLLSMGGLAMVLFNLDLDGIEQAEEKRRRGGQQLDASNEANASFQGREIHVIGAGEDKRIVAQGGSGDDIELVETGTSHVPHFPRTIYLPSSSSSPAAGPDVVGTAEPNAPGNPGNTANQEEYTLIGLGIRSVMWIQVYVVGMYVRTKDITTLQEKLVHNINSTASTLIPSEKGGLRDKLTDAEESREFWTGLLRESGVKTAWRISPTRNTDFGHLRDGFVNGINARKAEARKLTQGGETEYDSEDFGNAVQNLKGIFSGGKAPKESVLILARNDVGKLDVLFQAKPDGKRRAEMEHMGSVADERISRLVWLGYLAGEKVSSPGARDGVVDGCVAFASRPIGSIETRVI